MSEDVKLPETVEELQRERRRAFETGGAVAIQHGLSRSQIKDEAKAWYPIRKKVPRQVDTPAGGAMRFSEGGTLVITGPFASDNLPPILTISPQGVEALRDLLANPYEEVDE